MASGFSRKSGGGGLTWPLVILVAGVLAYANSLSGPLLFDDENSILNNPTLRSVGASLSPPRDTPVAGRPVVNLTFALNHALGGVDVTGYHVVNVAIHIAAALVLFGIVRRTLRLPSLADRFAASSAGLPPEGGSHVAVACALLWLLHPLQTEAVNYLTQRTESLMGLFYLLTLYCSIRRWTGAAVAACALGMLCKESMVTAPVMVVLYDRVFMFDSVRDAFRARRGLYAGLAATWLVLAAVMASTPRTSIGFSAGTDAWTYLLNQAEMVARYLWLSIWPRALVLDYGLPRPLTPADVVLPGAIVVAALAATAVALRYAPKLGFLGAWLFVTLAPTSSIVPIATEVGAERRMYLALAALVVLVVIALSRLRGWQFAVPVAALCALAAAGTVLRNQEYRSRLEIARTIVERRPHGRGHFLFGNELLNAGQREPAMAQFRLSARDYPGAHFALGTELLGEGRLNEGVAEIETFLRLLPDHVSAVPARDLLGQGHIALRNFGAAADQFRYLADNAPTYRGSGNGVLTNLGYALAASGRIAESVPVLERAVAAEPGNAAARDLLGRVRPGR